MTFNDHFSRHAAAYADARPGYPAALFTWLAGRCPARTIAWDAGCGNGQASVALAAHFAAVFASDPSQAQIASAMPHPRVRYAVEPAERCSLAESSAELVTVAQAYHWFDHEAFCGEARRVLVSGGVIALWSYAESRVSASVDSVFDELHDRRLADDWPAGRSHVINRYRDLPFPFEPIVVPGFEMRCDWNAFQYLAYLRSWSASQRNRERTGRDAVAEIAPALVAAWGDPEQTRAVTWPLLVRAGLSLK